MRRHKAYGAPKRLVWATKRHMRRHKAYLVLKTLCHWLGMESKAGSDDLVSLAGVQSKTGGDEASKQGP